MKIATHPSCRYAGLFRLVKNYQAAMMAMGWWILAFGSPAFGQTDSLQHYLLYAIRNNPSVLQKYAEYQATLQKIPQVGTLPDPQISAGIFLSPMEVLSGKQIADLRLMQMFPWFGTRQSAKAEMSLMAQAKYESFKERKLEVVFGLKQNWYACCMLHQSIRLSEENLKILSSMERLAMIRFQAASGSGGVPYNSGTMAPTSSPSVTSAGSGMQNMNGKTASSNEQPASAMTASPTMNTTAGGSGLADVYRIRIAMAQLENDIAWLKDQMNTVTIQINTLLNRPAKSAIATPDTLIPEPLNLSLANLTDTMVNNNPMLEMLRLEAKSLEARKLMANKMSYPMLGVGLNYSIISQNPMSVSTMNGKDMVMPMITMTLPVYRRKYQAQQAEADLLITAARQNVRSVENSFLEEFSTTRQNYEEAGRRMTLSQNQAQMALNALNILIKSFSADGTGLSELLQIRQERLGYQLKYLNAVADLNTAVAKLYRLAANTNTP